MLCVFSCYEKFEISILLENNGFFIEIYSDEVYLKVNFLTKK